MKKLALAVVLVLCLTLAAYAELNEPVKLVFAAQEVGTGAYSVSAAIQGAMLKGLPAGSTIDLTTNSPGGVGAPVLIQRKRADLIVGNAGPSLWSYQRSKKDYQFGDCPDVRSIAGGLGHAFANIMFTKAFVDKTGCTTMEEVIAKKIPVKLITKKNGTLGELTAERVIEACGISVEDFLKFATWEKTGTDAIKSGIQDDLYDATIDHVDAGQATTTEICLTHAMHFVQLKPETLANLNKMGYAPITVTAGTWNGLDHDIQSMGSQQNVIVPASMPDDVAYALVKGICENKEDIAAAVASLAWFDPKTAGKHDLNGAPLHPGAVKYYKEMGYEFDEFK